jgi:hypothetical protein
VAPHGKQGSCDDRPRYVIVRCVNLNVCSVGSDINVIFASGMFVVVEIDESTFRNKPKKQNFPNFGAKKINARAAMKEKQAVRALIFAIYF